MLKTVYLKLSDCDTMVIIYLQMFMLNSMSSLTSPQLMGNLFHIAMKVYTITEHNILVNYHM